MSTESTKSNGLLVTAALTAGVLYFAAAAPRATATDPGGGNSTDRPLINLRAWAIDSSMSQPGQEARVADVGNFQTRPSSDYCPLTMRHEMNPAARAESVTHKELAVSLIGIDFPYEVRVEFTGFDALRQTWSVSGSPRFAHDGDLKALVGDDPHHVLVVQLSVLKE